MGLREARRLLAESTALCLAALFWLAALCRPFAPHVDDARVCFLHKQLGQPSRHLTQHLDRPQIAAETAQLNAEIERLGGTPLEPAAGGAATPVDLPVDLPTARGRRKSKGRKRG